MACLPFEETERNLYKLSNTSHNSNVSCLLECETFNSQDCLRVYLDVLLRLYDFDCRFIVHGNVPPYEFW